MFTSNIMDAHMPIKAYMYFLYLGLLVRINCIEVKRI